MEYQPYLVHVDCLIESAANLGADDEHTRRCRRELVDAIKREINSARNERPRSLPHEKVPVGHPDPRD